MAIGGLVLIIEVSALAISKVKKSRKKKLKDYLMQNGIKVAAHIDCVNYNTNYSVNGNHPYILECSYKDPYTNKIYLFHSGNIWFNVESIISNQIISTIDVYFDPNNPKKYYMEIDDLKKYIAN